VFLADAGEDRVVVAGEMLALAETGERLGDVGASASSAVPTPDGSLRPT